MQGFMIIGIIGTEKYTLVFYSTKIQTKSMEREMKVKGTTSWCVLVEYLKDNYYARFLYPIYHRYRERHFSILPDVKF